MREFNYLICYYESLGCWYLASVFRKMLIDAVEQTDMDSI